MTNVFDVTSDNNADDHGAEEGGPVRKYELLCQSWGLSECSGVNWTPNLGLESSLVVRLVYLLIKPAAVIL